jgi:pimeloyl-ACP methyl ester carboxylesterase
VREGLEWQQIEVEGRPASYGAAGLGPAVVFFHGWGLGFRAYQRPLGRLVARGCRVYAPDLPGFGGTADLPVARRTIGGYAAWMDAFLQEVGVVEPAFVVGHSFGGAVAITLAHGYPHRVRFLVLLNSVGGARWAADPSGFRLLTDRPLWDWALHFGRELFPPWRGLRIVRGMWGDLVPNLLRNPQAFWYVGDLVRQADLTVELQELRARGLPALAWWGDQDGIIPMASFEALCEAIGTKGQVVAGNHSWLLTDPETFDEILGNVWELATNQPGGVITNDQRG